MPNFREDLRTRVVEQLTASLEEDKRMSYMLAMQGQPFQPMYVCLGSGRCMYPRTGEQQRVCAFCKRVEGNTSEADVKTIAKIFVGGN
jgi:hypothetical protein